MTLHFTRTSTRAEINRWVRQNMSRDSLIDALKTLSWLAPLTLLIWVYAERQQTSTVADQTIPIKLVSSDPNRYVELQMPEKTDKSVTAQLTGPNARLQELVRTIASKSGIQPVEIIIDNSVPADGQTTGLDTDQVLSKSPLFARSGVTVVSCRPARLPLYVDEYAEVQAEVKAPPEVTNLEKTPTFEPPKVTVRIPKHRIPKEPLVVYANLLAGNQLDQPGRRQARVDIYPINLPSEGVIFTPTKVLATFDVRQMHIERYPLGNVFVSAQVSIDFMSKWKVIAKDNTAAIANVTVEGPQDKIDLIKNNIFVPKAILKVSNDDNPSDNSWRTAKLDMNKLDIALPPGVTVASDSLSKTFEYKFEKASEQ